MNPRVPTEDEKKELTTYVLFKDYGRHAVSSEDKETVAGHVSQAAIAIFDHYITDSPGYAGKVMVVVWPGSPGMTETYIWNREEIELCPNEM